MHTRTHAHTMSYRVKIWEEANWRCLNRKWQKWLHDHRGPSGANETGQGSAHRATPTSWKQTDTHRVPNHMLLQLAYINAAQVLCGVLAAFVIAYCKQKVKMYMYICIDGNLQHARKKFAILKR